MKLEEALVGKHVVIHGRDSIDGYVYDEAVGIVLRYSEPADIKTYEVELLTPRTDNRKCPEVDAAIVREIDSPPFEIGEVVKSYLSNYKDWSAGVVQDIWYAAGGWRASVVHEWACGDDGCRVHHKAEEWRCVFLERVAGYGKVGFRLGDKVAVNESTRVAYGEWDTGTVVGFTLGQHGNDKEKMVNVVAQHTRRSGDLSPGITFWPIAWLRLVERPMQSRSKRSVQPLTHLVVGDTVTNVDSRRAGEFATSGLIIQVRGQGELQDVVVRCAATEARPACCLVMGARTMRRTGHLGFVPERFTVGTIVKKWPGYGDDWVGIVSSVGVGGDDRIVAIDGEGKRYPYIAGELVRHSAQPPPPYEPPKLERTLSESQFVAHYTSLLGHFPSGMQFWMPRSWGGDGVRSNQEIVMRFFDASVYGFREVQFLRPSDMSAELAPYGDPCDPREAAKKIFAFIAGDDIDESFNRQLPAPVDRCVRTPIDHMQVGDLRMYEVDENGSTLWVLAADAEDAVKIACEQPDALPTTRTVKPVGVAHAQQLRFHEGPGAPCSMHQAALNLGERGVIACSDY